MINDLPKDNEELYDGIMRPGDIHLGQIESMYYDGPIEEVHAIESSDGELRIEIRLDKLGASEGKDSNWASFRPTVEIVQAWLTKAAKMKKESKSIKCYCEERHLIKTLDAIQTHWYTPPRGCTEGDYWSAGEIQFICPKTKVRNRILFYGDDYKMGEKFRYLYGDCFKSMTKNYDEPMSGKWINNHEPMTRPDYFGLLD